MRSAICRRSPIETESARPLTDPGATRSRTADRCLGDSADGARLKSLAPSRCSPTRCYRAVDRRGIRVEAGADPIEHPRSDNQDRGSARIRARRVREAGKAMPTHALGEPQRSTKLAFGCLWPAPATRHELCAGPVGGLKRWRPRVDPRPKLESAPARLGVGEVGYPVGSHASSKPERQVCTGGRGARPARSSAGDEHESAGDRSQLVTQTQTAGSDARVAHAYPVLQCPV